MSGPNRPKRSHGGYKNPADFNRYMREYRAANRKKLSDQEKARRAKDLGAYNANMKRYRTENRDRLNENHSKSRKIGGLITPAEYETMLTVQGGGCAICGVRESTRKAPNGHKPRRNFCVDHDHETKLPRGLLCSRCNSGLGFFGDNAARLSSALEYLRHHKG